jgi:hypothetical protein
MWLRDPDGYLVVVASPEGEAGHAEIARRSTLVEVVALTSVPLIPRVPWWTKLARLPRRLWSMSLEMTTLITDHSRRQPSRWKLALIRLGVLASFIPLFPVALVFRSRFRRTTAFDALYERVRELWKTSPNEAVALLRSIFEQLVKQEAFTKMRPVAIEPFGDFATWDLLSVFRVLYDSEVALGHFEEALAVAAALPGRLDVAILQQVDCLVALGRQPDAIALLERNLDRDGWRGTLRRRLVELRGHLRAVD